MARLTGFSSFVGIAAVVLGSLRVLHLATPVVFPATRSGPITVTTLDDVRRIAGFEPLVPAYHPAALGANPTSISVRLGPTPTVVIVWNQSEGYLSVTTRRGGPRPGASPLAVAFGDLPDSVWWFDGSRAHALVARDGLWIEIETSLGEQELKRFADTLSRY